LGLQGHKVDELAMKMNIDLGPELETGALRPSWPSARLERETRQAHPNRKAHGSRLCSRDSTPQAHVVWMSLSQSDGHRLGAQADHDIPAGSGLLITAPL
jgi:hypothetical protein